MDYRYIPFVIIFCVAGLPVWKLADCEDFLSISNNTDADEFGADAIGLRTEYISIEPTGV